MTVYCDKEFNDEPLINIIPALQIDTNTVIIDLMCPLGEAALRNYFDRLDINDFKNVLLFGKRQSTLLKEIFAGASSIVSLDLAFLLYDKSNNYSIFQCTHHIVIKT